MKKGDYTTLSIIMQSLKDLGSAVDNTDISFKEKVEITSQIQYVVDTINLTLIRGREEAENGVIKPAAKWQEIVRFFLRK